VAAESELPNFPGRDGGAEEDGDNVHHGAGNPAENETIHQETEVDGFEATKESGWFAGVTELGEFDVGHDFRATPITREEKYGEHAGEALIPPKPISGDALRGDETRNEERRIGGEGGGDHRSAGKPPGDVAARDEKLRGVTAGAAAVIDADQKIDEEIADDDNPVGGCKGHEPLSVVL